MKLLAIETSCDDASVAIVEGGPSLDVMLDRKPDDPSGAQDRASMSSGSPMSVSASGSGSRMTQHPVKILAERTASQVELGKKYGGVFPELAAREHFVTLLPTIEETLLAYAPGADPRETLKSLDAIAVTAGPGLIGSLLVGVTVAQALAMGLGKKLIPVNHLAGHIYSTWLEDAEVSSLSVILDRKPDDSSGAQDRESMQPGSPMSVSASGSGSRMTTLVPEFPTLALTVSGGHTHLVWMEKAGSFEVLGRTRDDAAGEAFDKVSVMLGLGYPGGPAIQSAAADWKNQDPSIKNQISTKYKTPKLPRPMIDEGLEFSFSGLKTAVRYWLDGLSFPTGSPTSETGSGIQFDASTPGSSIRSGRQGNLPVKDDSQRNLPIDLVGAAAYEVQEAITDVLVTKLLRAAEERDPRSLILAGGVAANQRLREKLIEQLQGNHPRGEDGQLHPWGVRLFISSRKHSTDNGAMIGAAALAMIGTGFEPVDPATVEARSSWPLVNW